MGSDKTDHLPLDESIQACVFDVAEVLCSCYSYANEDSPNKVLSQYPNPTIVVAAHKLLIDLMLPGRLSRGPESGGLHDWLGERLLHAVAMLRPEIEAAIPFKWLGAAAIESGNTKDQDAYEESCRVVKEFLKTLLNVRSFILDDVKAAYEGDPAALSYAEVKLSYPGLLAIVSHRLAHELYKLNIPLIPRIMSEWAHAQTGVDMHPGAVVGRSFFIDHATGVVIGETTHIGNRVKLYQGVTLGAKSFPLDEHGKPIKHIKRHPTVEDDVVIYAHATVLGGDTVIGARSIVGANVFLMESMLPDSVVTFSRPELLTKSLVR